MKKRTITVLLLILVIYLPFAMFLLSETVPAGLNVKRCSELFINGRTVSLFSTSVFIAGASSLISLLGGGLVAFILVRSDLYRSKWLALLSLLPIAVPGFVYVEGVVFLSELSGKDLFSQPVLITLLGIIYLPVAAVIIASGLKSVPRSMEESAILLLPGNRWFWSVTLPWMRPYIFSAFALTFIFSFSNYEIPSLMNTPTYTFYIFNQFGAFYNFLDALYLMIPVLLLFTVVVGGEIRIMGNRPFFNLSLGISDITVKTGSFVHILLLLFLFGSIIVVSYPLAILIVKASAIRNITGLISSYIREIGYSVLLAATGALIAAFCGLLYVKEMIAGNARMKRALLIMSFIPFAIPPAFLAIGAIKISGKIFGSGFLGTTTIMIWAMTARLFPVIVHVLYARAVSINRRAIEAYELAAGGWWRNFVYHWIPMNLPAIKQSILIYIIFSLADIGMAVLLVPPDCMTAALNIYSMLHYGFGKEVAVETLLLLFVTVAAGTALLWRTIANGNSMARGVRING